LVCATQMLASGYHIRSYGVVWGVIPPSNTATTFYGCVGSIWLSSFLWCNVFTRWRNGWALVNFFLLLAKKIKVFFLFFVLNLVLILLIAILFYFIFILVYWFFFFYPILHYSVSFNFYIKFNLVLFIVVCLSFS
jgi:hypothetical protein